MTGIRGSEFEFKIAPFPRSLGFPGGSMVKNPPAMQEMQVQSPGFEDPLEEEMTIHSSIIIASIKLWKLVGYLNLPSFFTSGPIILVSEFVLKE